MHFSGKNCLNTPHIGQQSGSTNLPTAITYSAPILAVLSLLLLFTARHAQAQTETILYNFTGGSDGGDSRSRLTPDGKGNFYGTTNYGGLPGSWGTVFELSANGNGGWTETVIYTFKGGAHGSHPLFSGVIFDSTGNLYGTTYDGGVGCAPNGCGTVYKLTPKESKWTETVLYSFAGGVNDGFNPSAGLVMDAAGNLYGTTYSGGSAGGGIVFELSRSGGKWKEQTLYASANGLYYFGIGGIAIDPAGNLYGNNYDSVFELSPSGKGSWNLNVLHTFTGPTCQNCALGTPAFDRAGNLYGTTVMEGPWGGVFKLSPDKNGKWKEKIIHTFDGYFDKKDGTADGGALLIDAAGNIFGVTTLGGTGDSQGTVFELVAPVGGGTYENKILQNFGVDSGDGIYPIGGLVQDSSGNLYGTTTQGGGAFGGIVYELTP
jgi:uncharacterized repeat protein (TIGR03803 family)